MHKWIMFVLFCTACVVAVIGIIPTVQPTKKEPTTAINTPAAPVDEAAATAVYKQSCIACHGVNLEGKIGPNLQTIGRKLTATQIINQIKNGGGSMPPFKGTLTDTQINNLANWLAAKK